MTTPQITISVILLITLVMFAWGKWRHDIVAMSCLLMAVVAGVLPANEAFTGFGHAAVVTVAAVLIISHALKNAGVVSAIAAYLTPLTGNIYIHIASLTLVVTVASAFMNNVGALALMLPVAIATANEANRSPALVLMPLAFGSILGGMTTLIGTPPNIIIASYRAEVAGEPFSMFDFSPVGALVAIVGLTFIVFIGWRLIPGGRGNRGGGKGSFEISHYLTEVQVKADSPLIGQPLEGNEVFNNENLDVIGFAQNNGFARPPDRHYLFAEGDILLLQADPAYLQEIALALVGIARNGEIIKTRLKRQQFKSGDVLLIFGNAKTIDEQFKDLGLWPLERRPLSLNRRRQVIPALLVFAAAIAIGVAGLVTLPIAFLMAIMAFLLMKVISVREIYDEIDWPVIVLLGAMIPVGRTLESTGTTEWLAQQILVWTDGMSPAILVAMILVITMFLSDIINNAATALVMAPIGVAIASTLGVNSDAFLMAVAVGASCAFLTPIGHQSNTLVMGPGGYQFGDYWRMGLPLEIVIVALAVPLLLWVWPL